MVLSVWRWIRLDRFSKITRASTKAAGVTKARVKIKEGKAKAAVFGGLPILEDIRVEDVVSIKAKGKSKQKGKKGKSKKGSKGKGKTVDPDACRICGNKGHWGNECPNRSTNQVRQAQETTPDAGASTSSTATGSRISSNASPSTGLTSNALSMVQRAWCRTAPTLGMVELIPLVSCVPGTTEQVQCNQKWSFWTLEQM